MNFFKRLQGKRSDEAKRKAVYTFIFGDYDYLKLPTIITPGWDYICFTDDPTLRSDVWDVRLSPLSRADRQLGHVDTADRYAIRGWAADRNRLNSSISVSLYDGNTLITTLPANHLRPDVNAYLGDNGPHGFSIPIPASLKNGAAHSISVKFETSNISLPV